MTTETKHKHRADCRAALAPVEGRTPLVDFIPATALVAFCTSELSDVIAALRGTWSPATPETLERLAARLETIRTEAHERFVGPRP
jgi:hypothetical protein